MKFKALGYEIEINKIGATTMAELLQPHEYDASYFDGASQATRHNAGYSKYERWYRNDGENSTGEFWKDQAARWANHLALSGKKVLEIGSAKGFLVEDLREMGVDAYGLDISQYAYDQASEDVKPYLTVGDARTMLGQYKRNEFDVLISLRFIECIPISDIPALVSEMNRISRTQVHVVDDFTGSKSGAGQFYVQKTQQQWLDDFDWDRGTKIVAQENLNSILTK